MKKLFTMTAAVLCIAGAAGAQNLQSGYFLENYAYNYRINPAAAIDNDLKVIASAGIGNISLNPGMNVGLSSFLFPVNGQLVTGLNKNVPAETFLGGLPDKSIANIVLNENLATAGWLSKSGKMFHTIEVNLRSDNNFGLTKDLFTMLKKGIDQSAEYKIGDCSLASANYIEIAYGLSGKIGDHWKYGARIKGLLGIASASLDINKYNAKVSGNGVILSSDIQFVTSTNAISFPQRSDGTIEIQNPTFNFNNFGISGYGAAIDFGTIYEPIDGLTLGLAVTDLGFMSWKSGYAAKMSTTDKYYTAKEFQEMTKDPWNLIQMNPDASYSSTTTYMLSANVNLSAKYKMPFYKKLAVGFLANWRTQSITLGNTVQDYRIGLAYTPWPFWSMSVNYGYGTYGNQFGCAMNIRAGNCIAFFVGIDSLTSVLNVTPQMVPIDPLCTRASVGIMVAIGKKNR